MLAHESSDANPEVWIPAVLVGLQPSVHPNEYILGDKLGDKCTIGRSSIDCQIRVDSPSRQISRIHAEIERKRGHFILTDLRSANGTYVNGKRLRLNEQHILKNEDSIGLASETSVLQFIDGNSTSEIKPWLTYDDEQMRFYFLKCPLNLSAMRFRLLRHMYKHSGEVCTREQCIEILWGSDYSPGEDANLDNVISLIRQDLYDTIPRDKADRGQLISTIRERLLVTRRGLGYVLYRHPDQADMIDAAHHH